MVEVLAGIGAIFVIVCFMVGLIVIVGKLLR